jgi:hypothetical protein
MVILRPRGKDEVGECDAEYRQAEEESVDDPLYPFFGLSLIHRRRHPSANDCSARLVCFHVAGSFFAVLFPQHASATYPAAMSRLSGFPISAAVKRRGIRQAERFATDLVVAIAVVAGPDSLPAPRCRLPTPARAAIETNAGDERRRGEGKEPAIMESMETSERKPIEAWSNSWPKREVAGPDESTAESGTAEPSAYRRAAEPSAYRRAAEPSAYRRAAEAAAYRRAAEAAAYRRTAETAAYRRTAETAARHSAAKATTPVKAPSVEAATPTHPGIRCG